MTMTDTERRRVAAQAREQAFRDVLERSRQDTDAAGFWMWVRRNAGDGLPHASACRCADCDPPTPPTPSAAILDLQMRVEALERLAEPL